MIKFLSSRSLKILLFALAVCCSVSGLLFFKQINAQSAFEQINQPQQPAVSVAAKQADAFVDSIGVNIHLSNLFVRSKYQAIKTKLGELGVRHLRDGAVKSAMPKHTDLYNTYGIRTTFICTRRLPNVAGFPEYKAPLDLTAVGADLKDIKENALAACAAVEGPNEYDLYHDERESDWAGKLGQYQEKLYRLTRADTAFDGKAVIGPSVTTHTAAGAVGNISAWLDYGNGHFYKANRQPETNGWGGYFSFPPYGGGSYGSLDYNISSTRQMCDVKIIQSTECGYQNSTGGDWLSEAGEAKYLPRMYAEFWRRGIARSFKYQIINEWNDPAHPEANYGLLRNDLSEKPAFTTLKNMIALLKDPGDSFAPGALDYSLSGDLSNVRQILLQKRDNRFYLLLWQAAESFDPNARVDRVVPNRAITLNVPATINQVRAFLPKHGQAAINTYNNQLTINLSVPDGMMIVELTPEATQPSGFLSGSLQPSQPATVDLTAEGSSDWINWGLNGVDTNRKIRNDPKIDNLTVLGGGLLKSKTYTTAPPAAFSWNDGSPVSASEGHRGAIYVAGVNKGFKFEAVAWNDQVRTLKVYVGGWNSRGKLTATLSDGSSPAYSDSSLSSSDVYWGVYTINYRAASPNQKLVIEWQQISGESGNVKLQAATRQ